MMTFIEFRVSLEHTYMCTNTETIFIYIVRFSNWPLLSCDIHYGMSAGRCGFELSETRMKILIPKKRRPAIQIRKKVL